MNYIQNCVDSFKCRAHNLCQFNQKNSAGYEFQQAIYEGKTARISQLAKQNPAFATSLLPCGDLPLNYAIKTSQPIHVIRVLQRNGADPLQFDDQHLNALGAAYFKGNHELLNTLVLPVVRTMHNDLQKQYAKHLISNNKGIVNPFHYAAAIYGKDKLNENVTPAELNKVFMENLADKLNQSSPFAISRYDAAMFLCAVAWGTVNYLPSEMVHPQILQLLKVATYSPLVFNESLLYTAVGLALSNAAIIDERVAIISYITNTLMAAKLGYETIKGIKSCVENFNLNRVDALKKFFVVHVPKGAIAFSQLRSSTEKAHAFVQEKIQPIFKEKIQPILREKIQPFMQNECSKYEGANQFECEIQKSLKKEACVNPFNDECKTAENAFAKGVEDGFKPNYRNWKIEDLKNYDCTQYAGDNYIDCKLKHNRILKCLAEQASSPECKEYRTHFIRGVDRKFVPQADSALWKRMNSFRSYNVENDCDQSKLAECKSNYKTWQTACKADFESKECLAAENAVIDSSKQISWSFI